MDIMVLVGAIIDPSSMLMREVLSKLKEMNSFCSIVLILWPLGKESRCRWPQVHLQTHPHPAHVTQFIFVSQGVLQDLEREDNR